MKHVAALIMLAAAFILGLAACGGGSQPSPSASHTTAPSSAAGHTAQPGEPTLIAVPGYDYANVSGSDAPDVNEMIKADPQHLQAGSVHMVLHDGNMIAALALLQVKPAYANLPEFQQGVASGLAEAMAGSGTKVTTVTIHTEKVSIARDSSTVTYCWYHDGTVTAVTGGNESEVRNFAEAYLKTAHS
jgi:hypothetical protein